ncbi:MAG: hypothetical protein AAF789_08545 [Bacteroidota bacterium]
MPRKLFATISTFFISSILLGQLYVEEKTRHRFAQMNIGLGYTANLGGRTQYLDVSGSLQHLDMIDGGKVRFLIGGTHFWGHADFVLSIPIGGSSFSSQNQDVFYTRGVETIFKGYPWAIKKNVPRPFVGFAISPGYFEQTNNNLEFGDGPDLNRTFTPLLTGFTFQHRNGLFELAASWELGKDPNYAASREQSFALELPPVQIGFSYRKIIDTTISAEKNWKSGKTEERTKELSEKKKLNAFYLGVGLSSSFWLEKGSFNDTNRPYLTRFSTSLMPDFNLGYYFHNADLNVGLAYRNMNSNTDAYGAFQFIERQSIAFEISKNLFDYQGFVPFVGPSLTLERLKFEEFFEGSNSIDLSTNKTAFGLVFGWDIRPNRLQSWLLRTNLRWYPRLDLSVEQGQVISFSNIEFNFIQLIIYPERIFGKLKQ